MPASFSRSLPQPAEPGHVGLTNSLLTTIKAPSGDSEIYAGMTFESDSFLYVVTNDNPSLLYK